MIDRLPFWRFVSVRAVILYFVFFTLLVSVVFVIFYVQAGRELRVSGDSFVARELELLRLTYSDQGLAGLTRAIEYRGGQPRGYIYWLARSSGIKLAGNLDRLPNLRASEALDDGWVRFVLEDGSGLLVGIRGRLVDLGSDVVLFVGRDLAGYDRLRSRLGWALAYALIVVVGVGLVSGFLLVRFLLIRLSVINRTSSAIMGGDLSRRIPVRLRGGRGDEFDFLARNLNSMLSRIDSLVTAHREVANNIAHDLRSPLNRLRTRLTLIERDLPLSGESDAVAAAIDEVDHILKIFDAVLELAQIEAGSFLTPPCLVDLGALVRDLADLFLPSIEAADMRLDVRLPPDRALCFGHRQLLVQAVTNLIENALKYGHRAGGTLTLELRVAAFGEGSVTDAMTGEAILMVSDTGIGIPSDERSRVIERFVRLETARALPGHGLGLSLVSAIVAAHGGALNFSDNVPCGLVATLTLPIRAGGVN